MIAKSRARKTRMLHLLLIEDNPSDVLLIQEAVRTSAVSAHVAIAGDGEDGLRMLTGADYDLVILDLNLPKLTGHEVLKRYCPDGCSPIVVFTASNNPRDREKALALGAKGYVVKPMNFDQFTTSPGSPIRSSCPEFLLRTTIA